MDAGPAGGEGRRKGKHERGRNNRRKRSKNKSNRSYQHQERLPSDDRPDGRSILGGRVPRANEKKPVVEDGPPDAFKLFCAYHLGITPTDGYHKPHLEEVARRFKLAPKALKSMLVELEIDEESIRQSGFDLAGAQLDIRVAPEGLSRTELARDLFEELLEAKQAREA